MSAATLCELCRSIPFQDLPPFPEDSYSVTLSGYKHIQEAMHRSMHEPIPEPLGFHHHPDLESLRRASAAGCELCCQIEIQADCLLGDFATRKEWYAGYPEVRKPAADSSFDLWLTKRSGTGDGFWVVAKSAANPKGFLHIIATFGFCSEDSKFVGPLGPCWW